jgi:hypothetical protein
VVLNWIGFRLNFNPFGLFELDVWVWVGRFSFRIAVDHYNFGSS